jgi:hypothetical protein
MVVFCVIISDMDQLQREVTQLEREKAITPPEREARFSLRPGRPFRELEKRIVEREVLTGTAQAPDEPT